MPNDAHTALTYPYLKPEVSASIKSVAEDFRVCENLGFELKGSGEHLFLYVQKRELTTPQLIDELAKSVGMQARNIGYSGLKDKRAVTQQWISLHLPGKKMPALTDTSEYQILQTKWHDKKLRVGVHRSNSFDIILRNVEGDVDRLVQTVEEIRKLGFANYFGVQRFGQKQDNVSQALRALSSGHRKKRLSRHKKSLFLSALRSEVFNRILCARIERGLWHEPIQGDIFMLAGSQSLFNADLDEDILARHVQFDIHSALGLFGCGESRITGRAGEIEAEVIDAFPDIRDTLIGNDIKRSYRASRAVPEALSISYQPQQKLLNLKVELGKGVYLTTLLEHCLSHID
jgi:tRNA pseudouridine13 synthase